MSSPYRARIRRIQKSLRSLAQPAALLVSSAPHAYCSRDRTYPFRQDSDFYYLTGSTAAEVVLLISARRNAATLFVPKPDALKILWEGPPPRYQEVAEEIGAEVVPYGDLGREIDSRLASIETLYFQNVPDSLGWNHARRHIERLSHQHASRLHHFIHADALLEQMRLHKDKSEVALIRQAAEITTQAMHETIPFIRAGVIEDQIAANLEYWYRLYGAGVGFTTIAASGPAAATLHYELGTRSLKRNEMLLLDCGASYQMYHADITRMFPIGETFQDWQAEIYDIVLAAEEAAISKVRPGVSYSSVHQTAVRVLTEGLISLGVLRGKASALIEKGAYRPYFPHGIGHSLGLDVHDIGSLRSPADRTLSAGMVLTIEPGLYFAKKTGRIPACGVRIEDDILVTPRGHEVLTEMCPKERSAIETLSQALRDKYD